jgi:hypothetical protein
VCNNGGEGVDFIVAPPHYFKNKIVNDDGHGNNKSNPHEEYLGRNNSSYHYRVVGNIRSLLWRNDRVAMVV